MKIIFLEEFGKAFIPKRVRPGLRKYLLKVGMQEVPYRTFGGFFYLSAVITYFIYFCGVYTYIKRFNIPLFIATTFFSWALIQLLVLLLIMVCVYIYIDLKIFNRTKKMEGVLPEFLRYLSENLRGGMSFDKALYASIRSRYGVLADEIRLVAKKSMSGYDIEDALMEFTEKYDSPILKRSFSLIVESMRGGGEIAEIIERIETNLRETKELKDEMAAVNMTYTIFLSFIVVAIAPILFALSYNLLMIMQQLAGKIGTTSIATTMPVSLANISVKPEGFSTFSLAALAVIAVFSSMIMSIIRKGNIKEGLKYIPIYTVASIAMYTFFRAVLLVLLGGMIK